jgi:hypothetical protein
MVARRLIESTDRHLQRFIPEWKDEFPMRIHERGFASDGTPQWSGEFSRWLTRGTKKRYDEDSTETHLKLTRAMRKLRDVAPREHEVVWKVLSGESASDICKWLNDRAIRLGHPERYTIKDTIVIIVSGVDKLAFWY